VSAVHQTERFSDALDRALTSSEQREFDQHISACGECAAAYSQYRETIGKVRSLPMAKMPVPVRIPADLLPRRSWTEGLRAYLRRGRGVPTAIALVAAAGLLVVASRQSTVNNSSGSESALRPAVVSPVSGAGSGAQAQAAGAAPKAADIAASCVATLLPHPVAPPPSYGNVVTVRGSNGIATQITVAAPSSKVHAGDTVPVFASATVSLQSTGARDSTPSAQIAIGPCVETSTPATAKTVDGSALADVSIPASAHAGDKIVVYATVPAGSGNLATLPQLQVMLTLTVQ
jgi:Putative zinc-finger